MSELDLCSRREADRLIREGRVLVNGQVAQLGQSFPSDLIAGQIKIASDNTDENDDKNVVVVLNKPPGYVSGQAEHGHPPAIRLLTRDRLYDQYIYNEKKNHGDDEINLPMSWKGFVPAGRLDLDSTGLLVFCASGVVAKKLISHSSTIEKKYIADVEPAQQATRRELEIDPEFLLPKPTLDFTPLKEGGRKLLGDYRELLPCRHVEWVIPGHQLRLTLIEGRKHHIRRVCREFLGYHVTNLRRTRIGPIRLGELPEGCWRPLTRDEVNEILAS